MLKKRLRFSSFNKEMRSGKLPAFCFLLLAFWFLGCAPKAVPPPLYRGIDLSIDEVLEKAGRGIDSMKAVADVNIERAGRHYSLINASVLIKRPGQVHMRIYKFGMLVNDIVIRDDNLHVLSGRRNEKLKDLVREFYNAVFWWDGMKNGVMYRSGAEYILKTADKEIHIERETLLPVRQDLMADGKSTGIVYSRPKNENGFWYQSVINIKRGEFLFKVQVEKIALNPPPGEHDFRVPD